MHEPACVPYAAPGQRLSALPALGGFAESDASGSRWVLGTVCQLLRSPAAQCQAAQGGAVGHACSRDAAQRQPFKGRVFAGPEGMGCPLSLEERIIADECVGQPMSWES
jgi:hypothetical protein